MSIIFNHHTMMLILFSLVIIINRINGKFISNSGSSSIIVLRHSRLPTGNEQYRIRCPYNLNHLTVTLLNYSNENCFDLYSTAINDVCINHRSPCRFHAKPIQLNCDHRPYSQHVDVTYQCSFSPLPSTSTTFPNEKKSSTSSTIQDHSIFSSSPSSDPMTLHALSFPSNFSGIEESIGIFLLGLVTVFILWLTVCCIWFIRCGHRNERDDGKCELLSFRPYQKEARVDFTILSDKNPMIVGNLSGHTSTGGLENVVLHVNPIENKCISSLKITQID